jgi:hypothetical protein
VHQEDLWASSPLAGRELVSGGYVEAGMFVRALVQMGTGPGRRARSRRDGRDARAPRMPRECERERTSTYLAYGVVATGWREPAAIRVTETPVAPLAPAVGGALQAERAHRYNGGSTLDMLTRDFLSVPHQRAPGDPDTVRP